LKPKIIFIADWYKPSSLATATRFAPLVKVLADSERYDLVVYTDKLSSGEPFVKTNFFRSPSNSKGLASRSLQEFLVGMELFLKVCFTRADLVVITSPPFITAYFAAVACFLSGKKYFFDVRDIYPEVYINAGLIKESSLPAKLLLAFERFCYRHAGKVFTVTPELTGMINRKSAEGKCTLLRNGFSEEVFSVRNIKRPDFTVVFHGNLGRFQNPGLVVRVAGEVNKLDEDIRFVVIGDGTQEHVLQNHGLSNLEYLGRKDNDEVADIIAGCHLGVSFRTDDEISMNSMPVKIYEYIGVGIPVLVTPAGSEGAKLVEEQGVGKQFANTEAEGIAKEIFRMKTEAGYYQGFVDRIMAVRHEFSREKQAILFGRDVEKAVHS
jgi:glycosyltransferase involved in cell wall biosynthesis